MPSLSPIHLIIILIIALIVIGPGKLPEVGAALGKSIKEFRKAASDITDIGPRRRCPGAAAGVSPPAAAPVSRSAGLRAPRPDLDVPAAAVSAAAPLVAQSWPPTAPRRSSLPRLRSRRADGRSDAGCFGRAPGQPESPSSQSAS